MNRIYRLRWNQACGHWVAVSEVARRGGTAPARCRRRRPARRRVAVASLGCWLLAAPVVWAGGLTGGQVTGGAGRITQSGNTTVIKQTTQTLSLSWQSFNVGPQETVTFQQPSADALAINRIYSSTGSEILGHLAANGQVWLINPNGVLFGRGAQVSVGGLVASTLDFVGDSGATAHFRGDGHGSVVNQGKITTAPGGYVALLGHRVTNEGTISAQFGTVALGAGSAQTLTFNDNHLVHLQVDQSTLDDLVANGQLIEADGGQVIMTAGARDSLLASVVNNSGIVRAETVASHGGIIDLLGGGPASKVQVGGTLDAGAPHGGNGGSIETSAAHVDIAAQASITAAAPAGYAGTWLVDPTDLTIDSTAATAIDASLNGGTSVTEQTTASGASGAGTQASGLGDIDVDAAITWTNPASSLTLIAYHGINVNAPISGAGKVVMDAAGANLTLGAGGTVSAQGGITLGTGANFVNDAGGAALSVGSGAEWLVYSTNPTLDTTGGLTPSFIQYDVAYGATAAANGSGFLYSIAPSITVTGLTGSVSKVYDGGTAATLSGSSITATGLINGDTIVSGAGTYAAADAGTNIDVTSPASASAVTVTNAGGVPVYGYALATQTVTAAIGTITPAPLVATIIGDPTKVYDGTTTATLTAANYALSGFVGTQGATVNQPGAVAYGSASAGPGTITATLAAPDFTADSGTDLANYQLPTSATGAGTITPAPLILTGVLATSKTYDGGTGDALNVSNAGIFGVIAPDAGQVALGTSGAAGTFASANAGSNIAVTPGGFMLTGAKAGDYQLTVPTDLAANITPKGLAITGVGATDKVYDSTTTDALNAGSAALSGVVAGDSGNVGLSASGAAGTFASPDVGDNIAVTASGFTLTGSAAGNYTLAQPTGLSASITPAPLTISLLGNPTRLYNSSTTAIVPGGDFSISGFVGSQSASIPQNALAEYASPNAGTGITVTATLEGSDFSPASGTLMSNYSFPHSVTGAGTINPVTLTGYITNNPTKVYDATTAGTLASGDYVLSGLVGGDSITVNQTSGTYAAPNAGPEAITASLNGADFTAGSGTRLSNYVLPGALSGQGTIQPALLGGNHINGTIVNDPTKTYDGTTTATLTSANFQLTGWAGSDGATVTQTVGQYASANAGTEEVTAQLTGSDFTPTGSTNLGNYVLPTAVYGTGTINPAPLTVSIVGNPAKVYDGTTTAVLSAANYQVSGFASGEGASIVPASFSNYATKNVGTQTITSTLTSSAYTPNTGTLLSNYVLATTASGSGAITAAPLYVTGVSANDKVYDTTTAASLNVAGAGLSGLVSGDVGAVTLTTATSGTFSQADVGSNLAVTANGFAITGSEASNYALQPVTGLRADITPAPLTISGVTADSKVYDGTTAATLGIGSASLNGVLGSDSVALSTSGAGGTFASADAGNGMSVAASGFALSGGKASDYSLSQPTGLAADITPAPIAATITGNPTKAYDGTASATLTAGDYTLTGFVGGQSATVPQSATANYLSANAGTDVGLASTLVISDFAAGPGTSLANYSMPSSASGTLGAITPMVLNLAGTRAYDTTTNAVGSLFGTLSGLNGDTLTVSGTGTLNSKNVGTQGFASSGLGSLALSANGSALAGNYTLVGGIDTVRITPAALTVSGTTAANKVYDGTTTASLSGATLGGVLGSDSVTLGNDSTGTFASKNVGNGISVGTAMTISGADAGNYTLAQPAGITANITSLGITVSATGVDKVYDGTVNDPATLASSGVVAGDHVSFSDTSATFADPNVATGKTVSVSGIAASGADAGDYTLLNTTATATASVTPYVLNLTGTREYDANTAAAASLFGNSGVLTGANGEQLTLSGTGTLTSKNVAAKQSFSSLAGFTLTGNGGALASNYTLSGGTDWVDITRAPLTVSGTSAADKVYDGTTTATLAGATLNGVLGADSVTLGNDTAGTFATKNVGNGISVSTAMTVGGADAGNYTLTQPAGLSANITPLGITVTATGVNKVYDATPNDPATLASSGVVAGDHVTFSDTSATFSDPNVGNGKAVSVSGIAASGADAGDYTLLNASATTSANITPYVLSLTGTRAYDGTAAASATLFGSAGALTGVNGETLTLSGTGTLSSKDVNAEQSFASLSGFALTGNGGAKASNYTLSGGTDWVDVTPLAITVAATGANRVYDGTATDPGVTLASGGVLAGDVVDFSDAAATFATKNAGTGIAVTVSGIAASGADAANYTLNSTTANTTADITPKPITVTATGSNKVYNGNASDAVALSAGGIIAGDTVTFADTSAAFADPNVGTSKTVTVGGITDGGASAGNYSLANTTATTTADIAPYVLSLTGTRVYDGTTDADANLFGTAAVLAGTNGETLTLSGTGALSSKNVNARQGFASLAGFTLTGNGGALASNYTLTGGTDWVAITPRPITVAATGSDRTYNGNISDAVTLSGDGIIAGDTVTLADTSATFADPSAGTSKTVTVSGIADGGASAGNYTLTNTTATATADITPYVLSLTGTRAYDGTTDASANLFGTAGVLAGTNGETLTLSGTGGLSSKNVDAQQGFASLAGFTLTGNSGALAGNYTLAGGTDWVAITPKPITVTAVGSDRAYNGGVNDGVTLSSGGIVAGDTVIFGDSSAIFTDPNVGAGKAVAVSGIAASGASAGNYTLSNTAATASASITPYVLDLTGTRVYDGTTGANANLFGVAGVVAGTNGETLTLSGAGTLSGKNVNAEQGFASLSGLTLSGNGGAFASNYTLAGGKDWVDITPAALTVTGTTAADKVYDGTTVAALSGATLAGVLGSDSVALDNDTAGIFATRNVGNGIDVATAMRISGADAGNYTLAQPAAIAADITPKPIVVTATGTNRAYNGGTADPVLLAGNGIVKGDRIGFTDASATFATPAVGNGKPVMVSGIALTGPSAGNYALTEDAITTTADITPSAGAQQTAVAVTYLELSPEAISTPYGMAPSDSPGELVSNLKKLHRPVERNEVRRDFEPGLALQIVNGGVRMPAAAE